MDLVKRAAELNGTGDLYAGLRRSQVDEAALADLIAACDDDTRARLLSVDQGLLRAVLRRGAGLAATKSEAQVRRFLAGARVAPLFSLGLAESRTMALLTAGQLPDMPAFSDRSFDPWFAAQIVDYGLGAYGEKRRVYETAAFADRASPERRTVHLGVDVFAPVATAVFSPLPGKVAHVTDNADPLDYGHTLILQHDVEDARFFTLYGHLAGTLPDLCHEGGQVLAGQLIAHLGDWHENGGWASHLHFQVMTDKLEQHGGNFFGVGQESLWDVWSGICIDPNLILRLPSAAFQVK